MPVARDVVVVGAGISGCMTAYMLAEAGFRPVILERSGVGTRASGANSGTLGPLLGPGLPGPLSGMTATALDLHKSLFEDWGPESPASARPLSRVHLSAGDDGLPGLGHVFRRYAETPGFSAEYLEPPALARLEPRLNPKFTHAVVTHGDYAVDGGEYTRALAARARRNGADVVNARVTGFDTTGSRVTAVRCGDRRVSCGAVVIAAGPWTAGLAGLLGYDLPGRPLKGEMLQFACPPPRFDFSCNGMSCYGRAPERLWAGCTNQDAGFDLSVSDSAREEIHQAAAEIFPDLAGLEPVGHTAALRDATADGFPVCGGIPGWDNAYLLAGGGSKGLLLSAVMARTVCRLANGQSADPATRPADPRRFAGSNAALGAV